MLKKQIRNIKYFCIRLLRIKDKAHSIASGFTIGLLINFIPSFGLGPFLSTLAPKLARGNLVAGFVGGVAFIWAFPIFFYLNVIVGEAVLSISVENKIDIIIEEFEEGVEEPVEVLTAGLKIGKAFLVGMVINIIIFGMIIYSVTYYAIQKYRISILKIFFKN